METLQLLAQQAYITACDLLFPPVCVSCERVGSFLCEHCRAQIQDAPRRSLASFSDVMVRADYEGAVRAAIHAFKYDNLRRLADPLAALLDEAVAAQEWTVDLVTAVPMHESRLRARGYNQAALLGQSLARRHNWEFVADAIRRERATPSQVTLKMQERRDNVAGAFSADPHIVSSKRVLIIDDVLTTGATLEACADALWAAGAVLVYGAAVASPVDGRSDSDAGRMGADCTRTLV